MFCGKPAHHTPQCQKKMRNDNPTKANLVEVDDNEIIVTVISQINLMANTNEWVVDYGATRHIYVNINVFSSYTHVGDGEENVYLGNSRTAQILGKGKVFFKLTSGKTLAFQDVLHVPNMRANLIFIALKWG